MAIEYLSGQMQYRPRRSPPFDFTTQGKAASSAPDAGRSKALGGSMFFNLKRRLGRAKKLKLCCYFSHSNCAF